MDAVDRKPRILLVENDHRVRQSYEMLLNYWGYLPILATGEGKALIRNAIAKARTKRCILALIDLRLLDDFDEEDVSGLKLVEEIGPIRSIILSGFPNQKVLREMLKRYKDTPFLSKADSPEQIKQVLDTEVGKISASKRGLQIEPPDLIPQLARTTFKQQIEGYPDQLEDLFAQLMPSASHLRLERLDSSLFSSRAAGVPRPRSVVLRVMEDGYEPLVVKLARAHKIEGEVERYDKFISRKVVGSYNARLERSARVWDIGGAAYSFIGDFNVTTFSRYYEEHSIEDIKDCLNQFFTTCWGRYYERAATLSNVSLFDMYKETWGNWYEKDVKNFPSQQVWQGDRVVHLELPNPIEWFKHNIAEAPATDLSVVASTQKAVTHGDLHGDNLLIDSRKNAWVIDFERSGEGHALQDFVELEADIINRLEAHPDDISSYYEMCMVVASQTEIKELSATEMESCDPGIRKALETVSVLRGLTCQCTKITDARQYLLGLLFNTLFRATINHAEKNRPRQTQALELAGIFCHHLEHWGEPWPPEEWKSVLHQADDRDK